MDFSPPVQYAILFGVGVFAGTINILAGGGSMLTLPVMIFLGLPPTVANGTNRVAILMQNAGAVWGFSRHKLLDRRWLKFAIPPALVGAVLGTWLALVVGDVAFQRILAIVMVIVALWMIWHPVEPVAPGSEVPPPPVEGTRWWALLLAFFLIGVYGGFLQAGLGFAILAVCSIAGLDLIRSNALKVTIVLCFTPIALAGFAWNGMVDWGFGFALAFGNLTGAMLGVRLTVLKGQEWIRKVVTVTVIIFAIRLLLPG